jgi:hypothetical protein
LRGANVKDSRDIYEKRKKKYTFLLKKQTEAVNFISALRFIVFAAGLGFSMYFFISKRALYGSILLILSLVAFIILIIKHSKVINLKNLTKKVLDINDEAIKRKDGLWREFQDTGEEFKNEEHSYCDDLDVFGKSSLFQWINTAQTSAGRKKLAEYLTYPKLDVEFLIKKQQAVLELAKYTGWRQRFQAEAIKSFKENRENNDLILWAKKSSGKVDKVYFRVILAVLNICTAASVLYYYFNMGKSYFLPLAFIAINILMLKLGQDIRDNSLNTAYEYRTRIKSYLNLLILIENKKFESEILRDLQSRLINSKSTKSSKAIAKLSNIVDRISDRGNVFTLIFNLIFLWDYYLVIMLEHWKASYGQEIENWLEIIGDFEAMASLALISFDNPTWTIPQFENNRLIISGKCVSHPLLTKGAVANDVSLGSKYSILLITGSNMSGKSTFLRTVGISLVLSYAGAPVSAESFTCSLMDIFTCMRISDNLEKNISSFYAEIIRIKKIVNAANSGKPIFFLLDEIFKGTNSIDRHLGAETLINTLSKKNALGFVSTHDLELGSLEDQNSKIKNYNFQEYYKDDEIHFDYKLREGVSKTRNAIYLMKLAGIEFKE